MTQPPTLIDDPVSDDEAGDFLKATGCLRLLITVPLLVLAVLPVAVVSGAAWLLSATRRRWGSP